jgi:predicted Zn-dependent protease
MGDQVRDEILGTAPVLRAPAYERRVSGILQRLLAVTPAQGHWRVYLLDTADWNAMTIPGNYVFVFRGLLDALKSDDEVAAVVGHELAHRLAHHHEESDEEQWGEALTVLAAIAAAAVVASGDQSTQEDVESAMSSTMQLGQGLTTLQFSKNKEREADQIGLFLMADAGFNPNAAAKVWFDKAQKQPGDQVTDFFSTHPLDSDRYAFLTQHMPLAEQRYRAAIAGGVRTLKQKRKPVQTPTESQESLVLVQKGFELLEESEIEGATQIAHSVVAKHPKSADGFNLLGVALSKQGDIAGAAKSFSKGLKLNPNHSSLVYNTACVKALKGDKKGALEKLKVAFGLNPTLIDTARSDSDLFSLHQDPEFQKLLNSPVAPAAAVIGTSSFSINQ